MLPTATALQGECEKSEAPEQATKCSHIQPSGGLSMALNPRKQTLSRTHGTEEYGEYFGVALEAERNNAASLSDSGTEADDEKETSLKFLPPPPLKPRKGLRDGYGSSSPLLTPSYLDDASHRSALEEETRRKTTRQSKACTDDEIREIREKFTKRRRAEFIRRITETCLLGAIGTISVRYGLQRLLKECRGGPLSTSGALSGHRITNTILYYIIILTGIYALYPVRIILNNYQQSMQQKKAWYHIHIPAAFDPAPLIYPTIIPFLIASSLYQASPFSFLLNMCLGLASVPSKIIPLQTGVPWYYSPQWLLSALPIMIGQRWTVSTDQSTAAEYEIDISFIYPLHQALMSVLGYLTTTSLLPAELQLLSTSFVNLLLLAASPQAVILKALLWIGGLSILSLCREALLWEVAIARVPSWRFRRSRLRTPPQGRMPLIEAVDDCLGGRLSSWGVISGPEVSDSDEESPLIPRRSIRASKVDPFRLLTCNTQERDTMTQPFLTIGGQTSSLVHSDKSVDAPVPLAKTHRSFTLPSNLDRPDGPRTDRSHASGISGRTRSPPPWSFRSFTAAQAVVLKWAIALYTYSIVIVIIAFPIRLYITKKALGGQDPFIWAISYLFDDIWRVGALIESLGTDHRRPKPLLMTFSSALHKHSLADVTAKAVGLSNIRLLISLYCLGVIVVGLVAVFRLSNVVEVDTRRKVFHGMMVVMFLPTIFIDPAFVCLALIIVLSIFLLLDLFRASQLPPLSRPLTYFLAPYVDGRDHRGPVIVSHIFLLIGCAIPLWLSLAGSGRTDEAPWQGWDVPNRDLGMISGVVCVGMGDAAASLVGRRFGRRRWPWSGGKSLEGSLAFAVAVIIGLMSARLWLLYGDWAGDNGDTWVSTFGKAMVAACGASLTEAVLTGGNDNVIVPVILWLLVMGLKI